MVEAKFQLIFLADLGCRPATSSWLPFSETQAYLHQPPTACFEVRSSQHTQSLPRMAITASPEPFLTLGWLDRLLFLPLNSGWVLLWVLASAAESLSFAHCQFFTFSIAQVAAHSDWKRKSYTAQSSGLWASACSVEVGAEISIVAADLASTLVMVIARHVST